MQNQLSINAAVTAARTAFGSGPRRTITETFWDIEVAASCFHHNTDLAVTLDGADTPTALGIKGASNQADQAAHHMNSSSRETRA